MSEQSRIDMLIGNLDNMLPVGLPVSRRLYKAMTGVDPVKRDRSKEKLTKQAQLILGRLMAGPATSLELQRAAHCVSHTGRVSELRRRGHDIVCHRERQPGGGDICTYELIRPEGATP